MSDTKPLYAMQAGIDSPVQRRPGVIELYLAFVRQLGLDFARNSLTMFFVFVFPLAFLCVFEAGKLSQGAPLIRVALVDNGTGARGNFADFLRKHERLSVTAMSEAAAEEELRAGGVDAVVRESLDGAGATLVHVLTKERQGSNPVLLVLESVKARYLEARAAPDQRLSFAFSSVLGASSLDFSTYAIPAIIVLALIQLAVFGTAGPLITAREHNAFRHLFLAPVPVGTFLFAHITVRLAVILLQVLLIMVIMSFVFGDRIYGSWVSFFLTSAYGGVMLAAMGYMIGGLVPNQQLGSLVLNLVNFGGIFLGQVLTDLASNPYLSWIVHANPISYVADACRQVALATRGLHSLGVDLAAIGGFGIVFAIIAIGAFRRSFLQPLP